MSLTCYLSQIHFALWLFFWFIPGLNLMGKVGLSWLVLIWLIGYALQVWLASL